MSSATTLATTLSRIPMPQGEVLFSSSFALRVFAVRFGSRLIFDTKLGWVNVLGKGVIFFFYEFSKIWGIALHCVPVLPDLRHGNVLMILLIDLL